MSKKKSSKRDAPQISICSWIMGGPIVVRPRARPLPPVLVTTELARAPKKAEKAKPTEKPAAMPADKPAKDSNKTVPEIVAPSQKVDGNKTETTTKNSDKPGSNGDTITIWTIEQDALLIYLKAANTSWKDITSRMSLPKSIVQARFKELRKDLNIPTTPPAKAPDTEDQNNNGNSNFTNRDSGQGNGGKGADGFSNSTRLTPDSNWTREDCEMLEILESRYREEKWLSIQASFYNMTGRMIAAEIIKEKLKEEGR